MTSAFASIVAGGVFAAIVPVGLWCTSRLPHADARTGLALAGPFGVGLLSLPLGFAAFAGAFHPVALGALGWVLALVATAGVRWEAYRALRGPATLGRVAFAVLLACAAALYLGFPAETPLGVRDEGLYTLGALALGRAGTLALAAPPEVALAPDLFAPFVVRRPFFLPGIYVTASGLQFQFPPLVPAWIAQLHATFGDAGLYRTSAVFALLAIPAFHALARRIVPGGVAFACTVAFALNPAQVWIARINLSEPLAQLMILGALATLVDALRGGGSGRLVAGSVALALAAFVRLDAVLVPVLLALAAAAASVWLERRDPRAGLQLLQAAIAVATAQAVAVAALWAFTPIYVGANANWLATAAACLAGAIALALVARSVRPAWLVSTRARARLGIVAEVVLVALFCYAAFLRPAHEPFAVIDYPVPGMRDFREASLVNLAAYLGWPALALGLAGACILAGRLLMGKLSAGRAAPLIVGIGILAALLLNPHVSPDHFWAIRRFVPVAIPAAILLAGFGLQGLLAASGLGRRARAGGAVAALAALALIHAQRDTLLVRQSEGLTAQLRELDAALPRGPLLVRDVDGVAAVLFVGFGHPVLPMRGAATTAAATQFLASCPAAGCTLLHAPATRLDGLAPSSTHEVKLARRVIVPTTTPLARQVVRDDVPVRVTQVRRGE